MTKDFELRGIHVAAIFCTAFAIIISVNLTLATQAVRTFPGLEVKNSYVASQSFDANRRAQEALGWDVSVTIKEAKLVLHFQGIDGPVMPVIELATLGRATTVAEDQNLEFVQSDDSFTASIAPLRDGNWNLRLVARAEDGTQFQRRISLWVRS
ncbi:FixH family protein [Shimia ponticola]|uniref:FixH family protein n=1 Tax=Shimia ponticola TaxID=2582893 RepID=UPI0011BEF508|nr:FixH family protein [Shimia ponticola]